jgi:MFS family permease
MTVTNFKNIQYYKFCLYGFLKNLRFFDAFILLIFLDDGLSYFQIGLFYSIREITIQIFEIPSGMLADAWGRRKSMLIALFSYLISFIVFYFANSFLIYLIAMILFGFAEAFRSGTHKAMIVDYLNQNQLSNIKTQYYGSTRSWSQMGSSFAAIGGAAVVFISGEYKLIFLISVIPYLANLFLIWSYPKYLDKKTNEIQYASFFKSLKNTFLSSVKTFSKPAIVKILFSSSIIIAFFKSLKDYIQPMISTLALSMTLIISLKNTSAVQKEAILIGLFYSGIFIITSFASRYAFKIEGKLKNTANAANLIYLFAGISILLSGILNNYGFQTIAIILFLGLYISQNLRRPIMLSYVSEKVPEKILATGLSVESQLKTLIIVILSPILGFIVDTFSLSIGIMFCGFIITLLYPLIKLKM